MAHDQCNFPLILAWTSIRNQFLLNIHPLLCLLFFHFSLPLPLLSTWCQFSLRRRLFNSSQRHERISNFDNYELLLEYGEAEWSWLFSVFFASWSCFFLLGNKLPCRQVIETQPWKRWELFFDFLIYNWHIILIQVFCLPWRRWNRNPIMPRKGNNLRWGTLKYVMKLAFYSRGLFLFLHINIYIYTALLLCA